MSIQHVSAVLDCRDPRLAGCRKLVLVTLANRTDEDGRCWPSQELLAGECGVSVRALSDHLKALEDDGFITRDTQHRGRGNGSRTIYTLRLQALKIAPENNAPAEIAPAISVECTGSTPRVKKNLQEPTTLKDTDAPRTSERTGKGTTLPDDWLLPDDWASDARSIAFKAKQPITDNEIENEADKFRDYWIARPGAAGRKLDWRGTWRNWFRYYLDRRPKRNAPGNRVPDAVGQHGRSTVADVVLRNRREREAGNGIPDDGGRRHDVSPAPDIIDAEYRLVG